MGKEISRTSTAVRHTPRHATLLIVKLHLAGEEIEAVVDTGASASVVEKYLACKLEIWKRSRQVQVRQGDGGCLEGNFVVNNLFEGMESFSVLSKFVMNVKTLDIRNQNNILELSWLTENIFSMDTQDRCLRNVNRGQVIPFFVIWIPIVKIAHQEQLKDGELLLIIEASKH